MKKLKILMIACCPFPGNRGTPSRILKMSEALVEKGHSVDILTYFNKDFEFKKKHKNLRIYRIKRVLFYEDNSPGPKIMKLIADIKLINLGKKLVKINSYDIIHGHHIEGAYIANFINKKSKTIYDAHITLNKELNSYKLIYKLPIMKQFLNYLEQKSFKSDGIVFLDKNLIEKKRENNELNNKPHIWIPTGTNINELKNIAKKFKKNPFKKNKINLTYTGSIAKYQNVEDIIFAIKELKKENLKVNIITGTKYEDSKELLNLIQKLKLKDIITIITNQNFEQQIKFLKYSDILISPRKELDGIPQKITNYMVFKKKIICASGSAKIIDNNSAYIYQSGEIEDLKNKIILAINENSTEKITNCNKIIKEFDWNNLIKKQIKFYYSLIKIKK